MYFHHKTYHFHTHLNTSKAVLKKIISNKLAQNISSLTLIQFGNYLIPLLVLPYVTRIVGIENYGELEFARNFVLYFTIIIDYGFNLTATRAISINRNDLKKVNQIVTEVYITKLILFVATSLIFGLLVFFDAKLKSNFSLLLYTYIINIGFVIFPIWYFQGKEKISKISIINFIIKILIILLTFIFLKKAEDFWVYNFLQSISQIIIGIITSYYIFKIDTVKWVKVGAKEVYIQLKDGFNVFISTIMISFISSFTFIILSQYGSKEDIGVYSTAFKLSATIQTIILIPFSQAFFPHIANIAKQDINLFFKKINTMSYILLPFMSVIVCSCILFSKIIISILFGEEYLKASFYFQILSILPIFSIFINLYAYQGLLNLGKEKLFVTLHVVVAIFTIVSSYILIPKYGLISSIALRLAIEFILMALSILFFFKTKKNILKI